MVDKSHTSPDRHRPSSPASDGGDEPRRSQEEAESTEKEAPRDTDLENLKDRQLGEFRLLRRLGRGGMADVYLAEQITLNRRVAVKVLRPELLADDVNLQRFEREAKAAGGLNHPNIVQVYMIGEEAGLHYIAQEYVQGRNLGELIKRKGPFDVRMALHVMKQVATALAAASAAGIIHRDIKPENILITAKGEVKVTDFGLAQLTQGGQPVELTQVGRTVGTPLYMSPEQIRGNKLDPRSDIYSFGVTCYHMLTGRPPFQGETALSLAVKHLNEKPVLLAQRRPDVPRAVCEIVHKMMARDPEDRYDNTEQILNDLRRLARAIKQRPDTVAKLSLSQVETVVGKNSTTAEEFEQTVGNLSEFDTVVPPRTTISFGSLTRLLTRSQKRQLVRFAGTCVLVAGMTAALGWWLRPANPLTAPVKDDPKIRILDSAAAQYWKASELQNDEAAWMAVIENFKEDPLYDKLYKPRVLERLASLYLRSRRLDEAEQIYQDFASQNNRYLNAIGYAGQAVIASLRGDHERSQRIITFDLSPLRDELSNEMVGLVRQAIIRNQQVLGSKIKEDLLELFQQQEPTDPELRLPENGAPP